MTQNNLKMYYPCHNSCGNGGCITDTNTCKSNCASTYFPKEKNNFPTICYTYIVNGWLRSESQSLYLKCDDSCELCDTKIDYCLKCSTDYYYTEDNKNSCYNTAPIGYILNTDADPKIYVKKNILKINQIEDIELKNIEPSFSGRSTIEFWMITDNNNMTNGLHLIWKNILAVSFINVGSSLVTTCWPRHFKVENLNEKYGVEFTQLKNQKADNFAEYETQNYNNKWINVRCAVNYFDNTYYMNISPGTTIDKNLIAEDIVPGVKNDNPERFYWQVGDTTSFIIAGGKQNKNTNIYFRTIALFKEYIPKNMNKFKD
jgi:hypothetical protein